MKGKMPRIFGVVMALVLALSLAVVAVPVVPASADPGAEWTEVTIPTYEEGQLRENIWVGPIALSPEGDVIFAGTVGTGPPMMYRSDDDGYTWRNPVTEVNGSAQTWFDDEIQDIVVSPGWEDDETIVVATLYDVLVSYDQGRTFYLVGSFGPDMVMSMDATLDENDRISILVGTDAGDVWLLEYPLMAWQNLNAVLHAAATYVQDVRFSPNYATDSQILAMVYAYYAIDGTSVTALITKIGDEPWNAYIGPAIFRDEYGDSGWVFRADIGFGDDYTAAPMAGALFVGIWDTLTYPPLSDSSGDLGDVWRVDLMPSPAPSTATDLNVRGRIAGITPTDTDVCSIAVDGDTAEATIMAGTEGYDLGVTPTQMPVYVSDDGGSSWSTALKPPSGMGWFNVEMGSPAAYAGSYGCESAFSAAIEGYGGLAWNQRGLIDSGIDVIADIRPSPGYATDNTLFMVSWNYSHDTTSLWKTTDGGDTWERILTGGYAGGCGLLGVDWFFKVETPATFPTDPSVFVAQWELWDSPANAIWKSGDAGGLFTSKITARDDITAWHVVSGTELWVGDINGDIWHTTNAGASWAEPEDSEIGVNDYIIDIEVPPGSDVLVGAWDTSTDCGKVYMSTDDGLTFERLGTTDIGDGFTVVAFDADYDANSIVYAATTWDSEVYRWEVDESTDWEQISDGADVEYPESFEDGNWGSIDATKLWSADDGTLYVADVNNEVVWRSVDPTASPVDLGEEPLFEPIWRGLYETDGDQVGGVDWRLEVVPGSNILFAAGWGEDGNAIWMFEDTISGPLTLLMPADGVTAGYIMEAGYWYGKARVMLGWEEAEDTVYEFQVALDEDFGTIITCEVMGFDTVCETEGTIVEVYLTLGTTYYWRVRVIDPLHSPWSEVWSFTTPLGPGAARPILESPASGQQNVALRPVLEWSGLIDATHYELMVAEDCDWTDLQVDKTGAAALEGVTVYVITADLEEGTNYCWKVRALTLDDEGNVIAESPWSDIGTFTTLTEPVPEPVAPTPYWVWVVIAIGAVLAIAVIVLIYRTRRPV